MEIDRQGPADVERVIAAGYLFDHPPKRDLVESFLARDGHHLIFANVDGVDVGFVSGVEIAHPDKRVEMLLYELGVDEPHRGRGIGRALTLALVAVAVEAGCRGMWVTTEGDNEAALATYRSAGASGPESGVILEWRFDD
jgi:ribosomal protein S18 acetylase RimI-like enzyme